MTVLQELQQSTQEILRSHVPAGTPVALLDFPRHKNAGDSLIWVGERRHLERLESRPSFIADLHCFHPSDLRRVMPEGIVLIHGGGNFGDRWPEHHAFRQRVLEELRDYPVVQLPQSMDFTNDAALRSTRDFVERHPDLTLLMRSHRTLEAARSAFPSTKVEFCPDLALGAGPLSRLRPAKVDVLMLLRVDREKVQHRFTLPAKLTHETHDWQIGGLTGATFQALRLPENVVRVLPALRRPLWGAVSRSLEAMATHNVRAAQRLLARGSVVITDRLHAMVLASLCGIPVVGVDNVNGKVRELFCDYLKAMPGVRFATDAEEAVDVAQSLVPR